MILDFRRGDLNGQIFDAHGTRIFYVFLCNTATGYVEQYLVDDAGKWLMDENHLPVIQNRFYPAPLRFREVRG